MGYVALIPSVVLELQKLLAMDVKINTLELPHIKKSEPPATWRHAWASLLYTVFGHPLAKSLQTHPIQTVTGDLRGVTGSSFHAFFSVVSGSRTVKELELVDHFDKDKPINFRWRWVAYALLSNAATENTFTYVGSALKNVAIENSFPIFTQCKWRDVETVVRAKYPRMQLLDGSTVADDIDLGSVRLPRGTKIQFPYDPSDVYVVQNADGEEFEIIRTTKASSTIDILVPGYGVGLVDRIYSLEKRLRLISLLGQPRIPVGNRVIKSNTKELNVRLGELAGWVHFIGVSLELLSVHTSSPTVYKGLGKLLADCPDLRVLRLNRLPLVSLRPLLEAYAGGCRISMLQLFSSTVLDTASLLELFSSLTDPSSTASKRLRALILSNDRHHDTHGLPCVGTALANVVVYNKRLQYIRVRLTPPEYEAFKDELERLDPDEVTEHWITTISLSIRCNCAFLSTLPHRHADSNHQRGVPTELDMRATSLIFEFAGGFK